MKCIFSLLLVFLCLSPAFAFAGMPAPLIEEGTVYTLSAAELENLMDADESSCIVFDEGGMRLEDGCSRGTYVSGPIAMQEFTKLTLSWDCESTGDDDLPQVAISVFRPDEDDWSPFITMRDGEAAGRAKGSEKNVLVRYRIELRRAASSYDRQYFHTLIVSGGEQFFTQENLITLFVMISASVVFVYRKRQQKGQNPSKPYTHR